MSPAFVNGPRRVLMTVDAVGGVWRYTIDLARSLSGVGIEVLLVGLGPRPSPSQLDELETLTNSKLFWLREPLDWMADHPDELRSLAARLSDIAGAENVDLLHLNVPSQARGLVVDRPIVVVSHSCLPTWWSEVRRTQLPAELWWQLEGNRLGLARADLVLSPTLSHALTLVRTYGPQSALRVLHNACDFSEPQTEKEPFVFAAARWWDEGKNGRTLDEAARDCGWPVFMAGATTGPNGQAIELRHAKVLGPRSSAQVLESMGRAAIFAAPSLFEPFGLAVLEAALSGAALVLADIPTFRELWDGAALFVTPESPTEWSEAFARLADDSEQRVLLGRLARKRAEQFSHRRQLEGLLDAYRQASVLASRRAA